MMDLCPGGGGAAGGAAGAWTDNWEVILGSLWRFDMMLGPTGRVAYYGGVMIGRIMLKVLQYKVESVESFVRINNVQQVAVPWRDELEALIRQHGHARDTATKDDAFKAWKDASVIATRLLDKKPDLSGGALRTLSTWAGTLGGAAAGVLVGSASAGAPQLAVVAWYAYSYSRWRKNMRVQIDIIDRAITDFNTLEDKLKAAAAPPPPPPPAPPAAPLPPGLVPGHQPGRVRRPARGRATRTRSGRAYARYV